MDKQILEQYIDACALIEDTKNDIKRLKKRRRQMEQISVKGSAHEFPYTPKNYHFEGLRYAVVKNPDELDKLEVILAARIRNAERIKQQVEAWMLTISPRMQRIIRYKIFDELTWAQVAARMGRKATADSVRMEYERFMLAA